MSVNTTQSRPRQLTRFALRILSVMTIASMLIGWSARSCAHPVGHFIYSDPGNRANIHEPVEFEQGRNPVFLGDNILIQWRRGLNLHYRAHAYSHAERRGKLFWNGNTYTVFAIGGLRAIGYIIDVQDPSNKVWLPFYDSHVDTYPFQSGQVLTFDTQKTARSGHCCTAGLNVRITFMKLTNDPLPTSWRFFKINALSFKLTSTDHQRGDWEHPINLTFSLQIMSRHRTCNFTGANTQHIQLPEISASALPHVGSTYTGNQTAQFSVRCDPTVKVFATLTDANNTSNTSNTLTNTGSAQGVGVQLLQTSTSFSTANCAHGSPCRFGPDSRNRGNTNQWQIGPDRGNNPTNPSVSFKARYIRTGPLRGGDVRAVSTITFSYQ